MRAKNPARVGVEKRHRKSCGMRSGSACNCAPSYRGVVYDRTARRNRNGPWRPSVAEARAWRIDAQAALRHGRLVGESKNTVRELAERWLLDAKAGRVRVAAGTAYKPSTLRGYESSLNLHVLPTLGPVKLAKLRRRDVQDLVDRLALTLDGSTVRNAVMPLRVLCRYAVTREMIESNPCDGLELPAPGRRRFAASEDGSRRERVATPAEADALIAALPDRFDRAIWATAFYAGLRRGELRGLYRSDLDLTARVIHVRRGWDMCDGEIAAKSANGEREVPLPAKAIEPLLAYLGEHDGREFLFPGYGRWGGDYGPFSADALLKRSRKAWAAAGLEPIGLHEARHTYASTMIASGIPIAKVSRWMGHSSISVTERVYYWMLPHGHDDELNRIDAFLGAQ